jgi:hypothetical protein
MRTWQYVKQGLDDIVEKYRDPVTGRLRLDSRGRAINNLRSTLLRELDGLNPDYASARRVFAGHSEMLDAVNLGRRFANGDIDMVSRRFNELSPSEQDMFRVGAVREIRRTIDKSQDGADIYRRIFGSPEKRERIRLLFRDPREYDAFNWIMNLERETTRTTRMVIGGSPTARIQAEQNDLISGALEDAVRGNGLVSMARNAAVRMISRARGINEDSAASIADYLFSQNPQNSQIDPATISRMLIHAAGRRELTSAASRGTAVSSAPTQKK